jgi:hypothetical protein
MSNLFIWIYSGEGCVKFMKRVGGGTQAIQVCEVLAYSVRCDMVSPKRKAHRRKFAHLFTHRAMKMRKRVEVRLHSFLRLLIHSYLLTSGSSRYRALWPQRQHKRFDGNKEPVPHDSLASDCVMINHSSSHSFNSRHFYHLLHWLDPFTSSGCIIIDDFVLSILFLVDSKFFFLVVDTVELILLY